MMRHSTVLLFIVLCSAHRARREPLQLGKWRGIISLWWVLRPCLPESTTVKATFADVDTMRREVRRSEPLVRRRATAVACSLTRSSTPSAAA